MKPIRHAAPAADGVSRYLPASAPRGLWQVARAWDNFLRHDMSTYAAALAYRGLFALFPFLIFLIALLNALDIARPFEAMAEWSRSEGTGRLPTAIRQWLVLQTRSRVEGPAVFVAAAAAVWAVATGARVLRRALDRTTGASNRRAAWRRLAWSLIAAPVLGAAIVTALLLFTVTRRALHGTALSAGMSQMVVALWDWLRFPAGLLLAGFVIALLYRFAPSGRYSLRRGLPGSILAAVLWIFASLVFAYALASVWRYGGTYGSFSAAIVLLVYLYLAAATVLFGAEVNAVVAEDAGANSAPRQ